MRTPYASIAAIMLSVLALISGNALHNTLVPLRGKLEGFSSLNLGLLGSAFFAGMLAGTMLGPAIIRRVGHVKAYGTFAAVAIIVALAYPVLVDPKWWIVLRAIIGFAFAGIYGVIDGWVQGKAVNEYRGRLGSAYQFVHFVAVALGQSLLPLGDPMSFTLFTAVAMLFALSIIPFSLSRTEPPALPKTARLELSWLFNNAPVSVAASLCIGMANGSFWSLFPVFGVTMGLTNGQIASFLTATILGSAAAIWPIGRLSDRLDRRIVMAGLMLASACVELLLMTFGRLPVWGMNILGFMLGMVAMTIYSVAVAHANDRAIAQQSVTIASGLLFLYSIGAIVGPTIAASVMDRFGPTSLFLFMAVIHAVVLAVAVLRIRRRPPAVARTESENAMPP
jgi:MFS family permease